jgi:hypothetical protein
VVVRAEGAASACNTTTPGRADIGARLNDRSGHDVGQKLESDAGRPP